MTASLQFPGGPVSLSTLSLRDSDRTTRVPAEVAAAIAELEAARHAICSGIRVTHELASQLNIACAKVEFTVLQHLGRGVAR